MTSETAALIEADSASPSAVNGANLTRRESFGAKTPHTGKSLFDRLLLPITALGVLVSAIPILSYPPGRDQGTYLEIGHSLLRGRQLYLQLWDNKPPGIFALYAAIAGIFGRVLWSVAVVDLLLLFAISCLLFLFLERYLGRRGAALGVVVHSIWHSGMLYYWIAQPETFQVLCVLAALILMSSGKKWKLRCFAAGLMCGVGFWLKYNFVALLPLVLFLPYLETQALDRQPPRFALTIPRRSWFGRATVTGLGFALTIAAVMGWIVRAGAWPAMREAQFEVLPRYAHMAVMQQPHWWLMGVVRTYFYLGTATMFATLVALVIAWRSRDLIRLIPIFVAAAGALGAVVMQVRFHSYYFQICYPFFAGLWAYLAIRIFEATKALTTVLKQQNRRLAAVLIWVLFANLVFWPIPGATTALIMKYVEFLQWKSNPETFYANYPEQIPIELLSGQLDVVRYVKRNTAHGDSIYLWGSNSLIYFLSDRHPPTRFVLNLGVVAKWGQPSWKHEIMQGVKAAQPRLIIVTRKDSLPTITYVDMDSEQYLHKEFLELDKYIDQNYRQAAEFDGFVVYSRN